jgi:hypothetical protein
MPERHGKLLETLRELESELASLESMDPKTRSALAGIIAEINEAMRRGSAGEGMERHHSLMERLRESAVGYESSHPNLFGIIERTINALGQMGI